MKHILLVTTGGTIGSAVSEHTIDTVSGTGGTLLEQCRQQCASAQNSQFSLIEPMRLLSENLHPRVWETLIAALEAQPMGQFDGIIVTHGTDTLAYTAAALSFYFHALNIPLLLVSSDYPLHDRRANGVGNFICAVEFIHQLGWAGVFVPYRNAGQVQQVHSGTRLACSLQLSSDFVSVQGQSLMQFDAGLFTPAVPQPTKNAYQADNTLRLKAQFSARILMIKPYPGLNYAHFNLDNVDAVLHDLYHSGTACATQDWGAEASLAAFIQHCQARQITVYLAPALYTTDAYQSTRALMALGAVMVWNMSIEAAYVKLMLAYGNFSQEQDRRAFMERDVAGELVSVAALTS